MEMIAQTKGMKFIIEPFNEAYISYKRILDRAYHQYISISEDEKKRIIEYLENDSLSGFCGPVNPLKRSYRFLSSRRVIKSTNANALLPILSEESHLELVYLIRHPIPQIISTRKYPYKSVLTEYMQDASFMRKNLTDQQRAFVTEVDRFGSEADQYIAGWCLDNLLPLRLSEDPRGKKLVVLTYEDLVIRTYDCMNFVAHRFNLAAEGTLDCIAIDIPSWTTRFSSADRIRAIRQGDRKYLVDSWCNEDLTEYENLREILEMFDISAYRIDSPYADASLRFSA
jgi:hypothetical protein